MKNRLYYYLLLLFLFPLLLNGQVQIKPYIMDGAFTKDHNQNKVAAYDYPEIHEKDIVWSRTIWREIDLRQKINHHFYYPILKGDNQDDIQPENMSLSDVIFTVLYSTASPNANIMSNNPAPAAGMELECFKVHPKTDIPGKEFHYGTMSQAEVLSIGVAPPTTDTLRKTDGHGTPVMVWAGTKPDAKDINCTDCPQPSHSKTGKLLLASDMLFPGFKGSLADPLDSSMVLLPSDPEMFPTMTIIKWKIKEEVFFDKKRSVMETRIIGLCPVAENYNDPLTNNNLGEKDLFWIYYPAWRHVLAQTNVLNITKNNAQKRSYLDIFEKRMFSSRIIMESNIMNRSISDYMIGLDALLEADRIQEEIFNIEHDLWEY